MKVRRLEPHDIALICQLYEDGKTVYEVAAEIGVSRQRVSSALKRAGVQMRRRSPTAKQITEMQQLYEQGLSLVQVGERTGFDHGTVWHQLRAAGVVMRDTQGRPAQAETQAELSQ
ncbi:Transposase and inactivated derivatives, IS30 family [Gordonia terrae]|nr:Transposase and inactivated derivatives, IS30 family [Clostridioides difficile]VTS58613.1 Transposase and inactivated derivatives, IS30 family [Gordonia terrae]